MKKTSRAIVKRIVYDFMTAKYEDIEDAEYNTDLIMKELYKEVWDMNKETVENSLRNETEKEIESYKRKLDKEYSNNEKKNCVKQLKNLIFDGIIIATLVGLGINQLTEIIGTVKQSLQTCIRLNYDACSLIIIFFIIVGLTVIIGKNFMDKVDIFLSETENNN